MVVALTLLLSAQAPAPDPLAAIVARSNRVWYGLREATTTLETTVERSGSKERPPFTTTVREIRRGGKRHFVLSNGERPVFETFDDDRREIGLDHLRGEYVDLPSGRRPSYDRATRDPLPPLEENRFDFVFETTRGLVLRSRPAMVPKSDEPAARVGRDTFRRLTLRAVETKADGTPNGDYVEAVVLVARNGLIRRAEARAFDEDGTAAGTAVVFGCDPVAPKSEPFTFDVATLGEWRKVEKLSVDL